MNRTTTLLKFLGCLAVLMSLGEAKLQAQTPFDGPNYANHWIVPGQTYVRVEVTKPGLYEVKISTLASSFPGVDDPAKFHIYHRGREVQILSTADGKLKFYGEPNDGSTDAWLYRPTTARANPYVSLFSDKGVYFITASSTSATPVTVHDQALVGTAEPYHLHSDTAVFKNEYSQSTLRFIPTPFQSYYEKEETWCSLPLGLLAGDEADVTTAYSRTHNIKLVNLSDDVSAVNPKVEVMINGRKENTHNAFISVGTNSSTLNQISTVSFYAFGGRKLTSSFPKSYVNSDGTTVLKIGIATPVLSDRVSVAYYSFTYPQKFIMPGAGSYQFNLVPATSTGWSRVKIENVTSSTQVFDITDKDAPKELKATRPEEGNYLEVMVPRTLATAAKLYVSNTASEITSVTLSDMHYKEPSSYNYFMVTNSDLYNVVNNDYRVYRDSPAGGSFKTLVVKINDIYDQFNYGEPSPVAIRRFVDYMISDGGNKSKYLLLVGPSTTVPEDLAKDLPGEVPTVGFPGSDILLVAGLGGKHQDVPAVAVGRIAALSTQHVTNYLNKVKQYEGSASSSPWRKVVKQMYGAKGSDEANLFIQYLQPLQSKVTPEPFEGDVAIIPQTSYSQSNATTVAAEINKGVGLLTYFGHGSVDKTWHDVGRVTNSTDFHYANANKYPVMYFNGCGIGNIFAKADNPISFDWTVAPSLGSIAFITNSYLSYGTPSALHLGEFYSQVFSTTDGSRKRVGDILNEVAKAITGRSGYNSMDVQNLHQVILQGDPALRILVTTDAPLPVSLYDFKGNAVGNDVVLSWKTTNETNNRRFDIQWSRDGKSFETIGSEEGKGTISTTSNYSWKQYGVADGLYYYRLKQVDLDGKYTNSDAIAVRVGRMSTIQLGPNPADGVIKIIGGKNSNYNVSVFSTTGVTLFTGVSEGELKVDFLSPGVYIIKVSGEGGLVTTQKIIKK